MLDWIWIIRKAFWTNAALMAIAEYVTKVHAICAQTGNLAHYSHRKSDQKDLVLLGEKDGYEPLSRVAFHKVLSKDKKKEPKKNVKKKRS